MSYKQNITELDLLEAIRKRPGMYVGDTTDGSGLHRMLFWALEDVVTNHRSGRGTWLTVRLGEDGSCLVADNGDPIPARNDFPANHLDALTRSIGGPDMGFTSPRPVRSCLSVLRVLSTRLELCVQGLGEAYQVVFEGIEGTPSQAHVDIFPVPGAWFMVKFWPDPEIFEDVAFNSDRIRRALRNIAATCPRMTVMFRPPPIGDHKLKDEIIEMPDGMADWLPTELNESDQYISPLLPQFHLIVREGDMKFDLALQWSDRMPSDKPFVLSWANAVPTPSGGAHVIGLREALRTVGLEHIPHFVGLSVTVPAPKFVDAIKGFLHNPEVRPFVRDHVTAALNRRLEQDLDLVKQLERLRSPRPPKTPRDHSSALPKTSPTATEEGS